MVDTQHSQHNFAHWVDTTGFQDDQVDCTAADSGSCSVGRIGLVADCRGWPIVADSDHMLSARADSFGHYMFGTCNPGHLKGRPKTTRERWTGRDTEQIT